MTCVMITINGKETDSWQKLRKRVGLKGMRHLFHIQYGDYVATLGGGQWVGRDSGAEGVGLCTCLVDRDRLRRLFANSETEFNG